MDDAFVPGVVLGVIFGLVIAIAFGEATPDRVKSHQPITPDLAIEVKNGQADTTFIYTEPEQQ